MKNCKTLCEAQTSSRFKETIQPPPTHPHQIKLITSLEQKFSYGDIKKYRDKNAVLGVKKWCSAIVFSDTKQKHVC